jgi:hypothetical protein
MHSLDGSDVEPDTCYKPFTGSDNDSMMPAVINTPADWALAHFKINC